MKTRIKVGSLVRYHPIIGESHDGKVYEVCHVGSIPSSPEPESVAWLKGKAGCVSMDALSLADDEVVSS